MRMRLLQIEPQGDPSLIADLDQTTLRYAILSHTWGPDQSEVTLEDLRDGTGRKKPGYRKIMLCGEQARVHNLRHFWIDTCCIDKSNNNELSEAINSMFRWYRNADRCYVYLSDVSFNRMDALNGPRTWEPSFRRSRWFTRGWTLQELIAPASVEFFSREWVRLGDKCSLESLIHETTKIPLSALRGAPLDHFSIDERLQWAAKRETKKKEDKAYCLLGIFDIAIPLIYGEEDKAFGRLQRELQVSSAGSNKGNEHWAVDRSVNTLFTGRKDILRELEQKLRAGACAKLSTIQYRIVIVGMGGLGKSEICLQLAHRLRALFWGIFWVDVSTSSLAQNGFLDIAERLKIPTPTWEDGRRGLANIQQQWLLVLDNADDPNVDYQAYIPPSSFGMVIMTSRNDDCQQYATAEFIVLTQLSQEDAQELVLTAARIPDRERFSLQSDARAVAVLLQSHPLALIQAGTYVARGHCTLTNYPEVFNQFSKRLLTFRPSQAKSRYGDVCACFQASVDVLRSSMAPSAQDALQLLPLLSVYGAREIPLSLFEAAWYGGRNILALGESSFGKGLGLTSWHVARLPAFMQVATDAWDSFRLIEAVCMLKALALISVGIQRGQTRVSMHPLLHSWARDDQDEEQKHASWVAAGCVVAFASSDENLWRTQARLLHTHLQALTAFDLRCVFSTDSRIRIVDILIKCGWILSRLRDDKGLWTLTERICTEIGLQRLAVTEEWVSFYHLVGIALFDNGKIRDSVAVLKQVTGIREKLAVDHPDRLSSQHDLAGAYRASGQFDQAATLLEHVTSIRGRLSEDHPDRLASAHELARVYQSDGRTTDAIVLLQHVVGVSRKLGESHPDLLASQHELARAYQTNGQIDEAIRMLEHIAHIQEHLTEDHPDRLSTQHDLACAYRANEQIEKTITLLENVVQLQEHLAEDHPSRVASRRALVHAYQANGQAEKAATLMNQEAQASNETSSSEATHTSLVQVDVLHSAPRSLYRPAKAPYPSYASPPTSSAASLSYQSAWFSNNPAMAPPMMGYEVHGHGRRRRGNLPKPITDHLRTWLQENLAHPFPTEKDMQKFIELTGLTRSQISNWFINARRRQLPLLKAKRAASLQT